MVFQRFRKEDVKHNIVFPELQQKEAENPEPARAGRGIQEWDPCLATPAPRILPYFRKKCFFENVKAGRLRDRANENNP